MMNSASDTETKLERSFTISNLKRAIKQAESYLDDHPDASTVGEELSELRAELDAVTVWAAP